MAKDEEQYQNRFYIYGNVLKRHSMLANVIEGIVLSAASVALIELIPFTDLVSNVCKMTAVIICMFGSIKGIKGHTLTETAIAEYRFRKNKRILHLRSPEYVKEKNTFGSGDESYSAVEKLYYKFRRTIDQFIDENLEEEDSKDTK